MTFVLARSLFLILVKSVLPVLIIIFGVQFLCTLNARRLFTVNPLGTLAYLNTHTENLVLHPFYITNMYIKFLKQLSIIQLPFLMG